MIDEEREYISAFMECFQRPCNPPEESNAIVAAVLDGFQEGAAAVHPLLGVGVVVGRAVGKCAVELLEFINESNKKDTLDVSEAILLFEETARAIALYHYHHLVCTESKEDREILAVFAAEKLMKIWKKQVENSTPPTVKTLIEGLQIMVTLANTYLSREDENRRSILAEGCYSRPRAAVWTQNVEKKISWTYYASREESRKGKTTLDRRGYVALPFAPEIKYNMDRTAFSITGIDVQQNLNLQIYYSISEEEVKEYLCYACNQISSNKDLQSLNQWLSIKFGTSIIAECHDARLKGLDLTGGNFSEVNFSNADLSCCQLTGSRWNNAWLIKTKWMEAYLDNVDFGGARLENSTWEKVSFFCASVEDASFSNANMECVVLGKLNEEQRKTITKKNIVQASDDYGIVLRLGEHKLSLENTRNKIEGSVSQSMSHLLEIEQESINQLIKESNASKIKMYPVREGVKKASQEKIKQLEDAIRVISPIIDSLKDQNKEKGEQSEALVDLIPSLVKSMYEYKHFDPSNQGCKEGSALVKEAQEPQGKRPTSHAELCASLLTSGVIRGVQKALKNSKQPNYSGIYNTIFSKSNHAPRIAFESAVSRQLGRSRIVRGETYAGSFMNGVQNICMFFNERRPFYSATIYNKEENVMVFDSKLTDAEKNKHQTAAIEQITNEVSNIVMTHKSVISLSNK